MLSILIIIGMLLNLSQSYSFVPSRIGTTTRTPFSFSSSSSLLLPNNNRNFLLMKVSKGKSKHSKSNSLHTINQRRKRIAGRPGSKHFLDPNKVFIGNLPYDANAEDVKSFLRVHLGDEKLHNVESVKVITDWKTNKSKGYGFIQFIEPMFATSAMQRIRNKKLKGRVVRLDQGRKKDDLDNRVLFVKRRDRKLGEGDDEESKVISGALDEAEGEGEGGTSAADLEYSLDDFDDDDDDVTLFGSEDGDEDYDDEDDDDDDDDGIDGWFEEVYGGSKWEELDEEEAKNMNREQRREAQRSKPRRKLPRKGFGAQDP